MNVALRGAMKGEAMVLHPKTWDELMDTVETCSNCLGDLLWLARPKQNIPVDYMRRVVEYVSGCNKPHYPVPVIYCDKSNSAWWQDWLVDALGDDHLNEPTWRQVSSDQW